MPGLVSLTILPPHTRESARSGPCLGRIVADSRRSEGLPCSRCPCSGSWGGRSPKVLQASFRAARILIKYGAKI